MPERESDLLDACKRGCPQAREELVSRYQARVESHVARLLHQYGCAHFLLEHRTEIVQQIWAELFAQLHKIRNEEFPAWFALLRRWRTLDYLRKEFLYRSRHAGLPEGVASPEPCCSAGPRCPESQLQASEERLEIRSCVGELAPRERDFIFLYFFRDRSYRDIASAFGILESSVGAIHARALRNLEKRLRRRKKWIFFRLGFDKNL